MTRAQEKQCKVKRNENNNLTGTKSNAVAMQTATKRYATKSYIRSKVKKCIVAVERKSKNSKCSTEEKNIYKMVMCRALQIYYINIQAFGLKPSSGTNYTKKQTKDKILQRKG